MIESGYYPLGAEHDPHAPWNEREIPEREFNVVCSQTLSKNVTVITDSYIPGDKGIDYEDGIAEGWSDPDDTSNTNWAEEYHDNGYHTPLQLLELFKQFLEENKRNGLVFKSPKFTEDIIEECKDWVEDETEYIED